ncbi:MAG: hypothetical protein AAGI30_02080 [Planctomycetota bacterium]
MAFKARRDRVDVTPDERRETTLMIRIMCPNLKCRSVLAVPDDARGRLVRCNSCGTNIRIPKAGASKAPPPPSKKNEAA